MSDSDEQDIEPGPPRTLCHSCSGMGVIQAAKFAVLGGVPGTVRTHETCPECHGERFLHGIEPPA